MLTAKSYQIMNIIFQVINKSVTSYKKGGRYNFFSTSLLYILLTKAAYLNKKLEQGVGGWSWAGGVGWGSGVHNSHTPLCPPNYHYKVFTARFTSGDIARLELESCTIALLGIKVVHKQSFVQECTRI